MWSPNKRRPTAEERRHIARVKQTACAVCDAPPPVEAHEPEQGLWMCAIGLCADCHRGNGGWPGIEMDRWSIWSVRRLWCAMVNDNYCW